MFARAGLPVANSIDRVPNSRRALMLSELARDRGLFDSLHHRLFNAYWARGRDIGDERVLLEEGATAGLDEPAVVDALHDERYLTRVEADTRGALEIGVNGVPAWLIDGRLLVPGAQPHEIFERALQRLGHEPRAA
jgi:predicted DsbA family dithiol-disulfide isomerase